MQKFLKYLSLFILLLLIFKFGCPVYKLFNITCPACGVTHAWIYLFNKNILKALKSNPFFILLTVMFLRVIYLDIKRLKINSLELKIYYIISLFAAIFNFYRIINGL